MRTTGGEEWENNGRRNLIEYSNAEITNTNDKKFF